MKKLYRIVLAGAACASIAACNEQLSVENRNNADQERALARPVDVENLIAGSFNTMHRATLGANTLMPQMYVLGLENYSALSNQSMAVRATIPRPPINNDRGNNVATENYAPYLGLHRAARAAAIGLSRVIQPTFTFFPSNVNQTNRARAFAKFVIGVSLGNLAMSYDSGSAINENDDLTLLAALPLVGYDSLAKYALANLDSARIIATAAGAAGLGTQTIPATWLSNGGTALTSAQFAALTRGWMARIRANVARDPAERAAVNWTQVLADANAFTAAFAGDFVQQLTPANGWTNAWPPQMYASNSVNWHMMWGYMAYFAATQAQFDGWLATPAGSRPTFVMVTDDLRWPQGATRLAQQCQSGSVTGTSCGTNPTTPTAFQYVENRVNDWAADPSAGSQYRHKRFLALNSASMVGNFPSMTTAEINLLAAEAEFRAGQFLAAANRIDATRVARGGLPALGAAGANINNNTTPVPNGVNGCVPRIPVGPSFTASACGTLWEALKYEKRIETQFTHWGGWWFDGRGWGDLPQATPPHWPVPYQEMDARAVPFYSIQGTAPVGTYGL
jgi:hypothetical protein